MWRFGGLRKSPDLATYPEVIIPLIFTFLRICVLWGYHRDCSFFILFYFFLLDPQRGSLPIGAASGAADGGVGNGALPPIQQKKTAKACHGLGRFGYFPVKAKIDYSCPAIWDNFADGRHFLCLCWCGQR